MRKLSNDTLEGPWGNHEHLTPRAEQPAADIALDLRGLSASDWSGERGKRGEEISRSFSTGAAS